MTPRLSGVACCWPLSHLWVKLPAPGLKDTMGVLGNDTSSGGSGGPGDALVAGVAWPSVGFSPPTLDGEAVAFVGGVGGSPFPALCIALGLTVISLLCDGSSVS